ncbi:SigF [Campylobacter sp. MIT 99-7217]|uniref:DUF262 domain-containing protein n=1 Tax=Campylobacter sp. MIT 99-7217 TaxID=535091 RepID=UPI00115A11CD|nr:DUF262 domain-containing protein [Campylobacter sp. MIT 99-7217]TQR34583.1 SigF [Campylobacter sp. MIT 99-7217]
MSNTSINFKDLIERYKIEIPILQRDYAQGRKDAELVREKFLTSIFSHLKEDKKLYLDFIYGSVKTYEDTEDKTFLPLDGQQRLTTLFLLYWYFGKKEGKNIDFLKKFSYETRASSRQFCQNLVSAEFKSSDFEAKDELSAKIKDSAWFMYFWDKDPTVKAMLIMIDAIHEKAKDNEIRFESLNLIEFKFIKLEDFGLDDDLYIKMNARGKRLSDFEIFKAEFEKFLIEKGKTEFKKKFSDEMDTYWTDLFWEFKKDDKHLIDSAFMNYFYFISEMLYIRDDKEAKASDFEALRKNISKLCESVYTKDENIDFLFKSIENLEEINKFNETYFSTDFSEGKLALFDEKPNLLEKIIKNEEGNLINLGQKILLFILVKDIVENKEKNDENLLDKLRVMRNLIQRIRGLKQGRIGRIDYTSTLAYENLHFILNLSLINTKENIYIKLLDKELLDTLSNTDIARKSLEQEIEKAEYILKYSEAKGFIHKIEDCNYIRGDLSNFLFKEDKDLLEFTSKHIAGIFESETQLIIRALLATCYDRSENDGYARNIGTASGGAKWFFGAKGKWEILLTTYNQDTKDFFTDFFEKYRHLAKEKSTECPTQILQEMIKKYLEYKKNYSSWIYYFIKYGEQIFNNEEDKDKNYFARYDKNEKFNIDKMYGDTMGSKYTNAYVKMLCEILRKEKQIPEEKLQIYYEEGKEKLNIDNKIKIISCLENGWKIQFDKFSSKDLVIEKFKLEKDSENKESKYILKHDEKDIIKEDIIEKAKEFILDILKLD